MANNMDIKKGLKNIKGEKLKFTHSIEIDTRNRPTCITKIKTSPRTNIKNLESQLRDKLKNDSLTLKYEGESPNQFTVVNNDFSSIMISMFAVIADCIITSRRLTIYMILMSICVLFWPVSLFLLFCYTCRIIVKPEADLVIPLGIIILSFGMSLMIFYFLI